MQSRRKSARALDKPQKARVSPIRTNRIVDASTESGKQKKNKNGSIIYLISLQFMGTMSTI